MRKDFACIVISHGRPECSTVKVLRECGYTGKIYIVVDDEDEALPDYIERYGADVHVFHKEESFDTGDLGGSKACGVFARNQCLKVAEKNNLTYYLELDDDLESLTYRYNDDGHLRGIKAKGIDRLFEGMCIYFDEAPVQCLGFGNAVDYVAKSIEEFGFKVPCVVSGDGVLITGHTRLKACKKLGIDEVPCIVADDLTEDQIKAFRIADNKVSEYSTWDNEKLAEELSDIMMDMGQFGDDLFKDDDTMDIELSEEDNPYSQKKHVPQYEPTGDFVDIMDLIDDEKTNELIKEIKESNVTEDQKSFLIKAAYRHLKFNYSKIADYYSNASEEMQILMEKSALVIIDIDDAIANGYVKLTKVVEDLIAEDDGGEADGE